MFGDGSTSRDYTYIDDILDGVIKAIDKPLGYEIINLGEHQTTSLRGLIASTAKHLGKEPIIEPLPMQPGDVSITHADIGKARRLLDYSPEVAIDEGIARFVSWYRKHKVA